MVRDLIEKGGIGAAGWLGTIKLATLNEVLAGLVALATLVYMITSTVKRVLEIKTQRGEK